MSKNNLLFELGSRIYERRRELNMTQKELAEAVELSIQSISSIELGKKAVRPENLVNICLALDVSADYLLFGERSEKQLEPISQMLSNLSNDDLELVRAMIKRLNTK
ncbi:MAG: helix-turn-helix transcriptional regulator [Clostridia bacterium]|nr:helix-turn-helix transcriptional regulator [Clostridia bacterium]